MPEMMMLPVNTGLLLPTKLLPKIEMGSGTKCSTSAATVGGVPSAYTWSTIIVMIACAIMVVVSAMKGVRRFSFALTYTNLWYVFGKRRRLRVRVHSFTSTNGSNCFVTTSGEFSAELVKEEEEEEELEKQLDLNFDHQPDAVMGPTAGSRVGCIVGTEMVFIYNATTSVFTAGSFSRFPQRKSYREALCTPVTASSSSIVIIKQESMSRSARAARAAGESPEWQLGVVRSRNGNDDQFCSKEFLVPEWALGLLEPLEIVCCLSSSRRRSPFPSSHHCRSGGPSPRMKNDYAWDSELRLRLAAAEEGRRPVSSGDEKIVYPSAVVAGTTHTASLRDNVVKFWDNSTRRLVVSLPITATTTIDTCVSSFDVDWEKDTVAFGNSNGEVSFWDLETAKCVTSVRAHEGSIASLHFNSAGELEQESSFLTAGRVAEENLSRVLLWDSRMLNVAAGSSGAGSRFRLVEDLKFKNYEVVARDENSRISMHDIRMLSSSPVFTISEDEINSVGFEGQGHRAHVGLFGHEEKWDFNSMDDLSEDDFEDDWGTVDEEIVKSPSVLSRCFNALSAAISR